MGFFKRKKLSTAELDAMTLSTLESEGADFSEVREVIHYVYSTNRDALADAAATTTAAGWATSMNAYEDTFVVEFATNKVINADVIAGDRLLFEGIAASLPGGDYDGWVASVDPELASGSGGSKVCD